MTLFRYFVFWHNIQRLQFFCQHWTHYQTFRHCMENCFISPSPRKSKIFISSSIEKCTGECSFQDIYLLFNPNPGRHCPVKHGFVISCMQNNHYIYPDMKSSTSNCYRRVQAVSAQSHCCTHTRCVPVPD